MVGTVVAGDWLPAASVAVTVKVLAAFCARLTGME